MEWVGGWRRRERHGECRWTSLIHHRLAPDSGLEAVGRCMSLLSLPDTAATAEQSAFVWLDPDPPKHALSCPENNNNIIN